jgi:hypothetical protein
MIFTRARSSWTSLGWTSLLCVAMPLGCGTGKIGTDTDTMMLGGSETAGDGDGDSMPWEPIPARGDIELTQVVVNQAVDVPISMDGVWVGPNERNSYVVRNRDTLLRGFWEIPDDWVPRQITAKLELYYPDGTMLEAFDTKMVDGPSFPGDFDRGFMFALVADQVPDGLAYHMSLWEAGPGAEDQRESTTVLESPIGGPQLIGIQPEPAEIKVVVMPVKYNDGMGCNTDTSTQITAEQEQTFIDNIHEQYPVQDVIFEFRRDTPIEWNEPLTSLAELWAPLQDQRAAENAAPNVYFYALVNACAGGIDGAGGIAAGIVPDTKDVAYQRVASGLWIDGNEQFGYDTIVHEVGHLNGRAHVFCAGGDAAGIDPSYPYEDGIIGVWGFGIRSFKLKSPTATRDFMTYCMPTWVSDWAWSKQFLRVRTLTSWDYEGNTGPHQPSGEVLIGLLLKDGREKWWRTPGGDAAEFYSSGESIELDVTDQDGELQVLRSPTAVRELEDGTIMITAAVPQPGAEIKAARRIAANGAVRTIAL